jgi:hypothetical protein
MRSAVQECRAGSHVRIGRDRGKPIESDFAEFVAITAHPSSILRTQDDAERREAMEEFVSDLAAVAQWLGARATGSG